MTKYVVISDRVGDVGCEFVAPDGINVDALIAGLFIREESTPKPVSSAKPKAKKTSKE